MQNTSRSLHLRVQTNLPDTLLPVLAIKPSSQQPNNFSFSHSEILILPPTGEASLRFSTKNTHSIQTLPGEIQNRLPDSHAEFVEQGRWRGFRLGRLIINPMIRDTAGKAVLAQEIDVQIDFQPMNLPTQPSPVVASERQVLKNLRNNEQAKWWRDSKKIQPEEASKEFARNLPYFRIKIRESGMYRISFQDVIDAAGPSGTINPYLLQLYYRGVEQPLYFAGDADSTFEAGEEFWFWGERLSGENGEWFHDETDFNVYQLVAGDKPGQRFQMQNVDDDPAAPNAAFFRQKRHFETDLRFYHGDNDADIFTTAKIPGEGWMWGALSGTESLTANLNLPGVVATAPECSLRARVRGITKDPAKPNHHVQIFLNGQLVAEAKFSDNAELVLRAAFPADILRDGNNDFRLFSVGDTDATIDQFYFDWLEIDYWRHYGSAGQQFSFLPPGNTADQHIRYQIGGFQKNEIFVFDLGTSKILNGFSVTSDGAGQFTARFSDVLQIPRRFLATTKSTLAQPEHIAWIEPSKWRDPGMHADMIIISHADFIEQAQRLADYRRQKNGFEAIVVDVREIYDEFFYGQESAQAIRTFLTYTFHDWRPPAPQYVLLMGDSSWDPKKNNPQTTKRSFVPAIGNPASDNRLVCFDGPDDFIPDMFIGRIAVETAEQADAIVDKIIAYENMPLQDWAKDFTFLNGGINAFEHKLFFDQSEKLIRTFVESPPVYGKPLRIYKTSEGRIPGELLPDILSAIDSGTGVFAFSGHAGSQTWELMMVNEDIPRVQNFGRLPFIASMTCHTARFAEPAQNSFGEEFLRLPDRGAVAFWGTSGWGFAFQDGILLNGLFKAVTQDTVRSVGVATTIAKIGLWQQYGDFQTNINIIDQYTLLGDPALALALPVQPDLTLSADGITTTPATPTVQDSAIEVNILLRNRGLATVDSTALVLKARHLEAGVDDFQATATIGPVGYADTVTIAWPGKNRLGDYALEAQVDPDGLVREAVEHNNAAQTRIHFFSKGITIATPRLMEVVPEARPFLSVYNPETASTGTRKIFFEIDTSAAYGSPISQASGGIDAQIVRTGWQVQTPLANGRYYWRTRLQADSAATNWQASSFFVDTNAGATGFLQRDADWRQSTGSFAFADSGATLPWDAKKQRFAISGKILSPAIGPAHSWKQFSVDASIRHLQSASGDAGAGARFVLQGRRRGGEPWQDLKTDLQNQNSLQDIDASRFPFLRIQAELHDDDGLDSPVILSWRVDYAQRGDLVVSRRFVTLAADSLLPGQPFDIDAKVFYFGRHKPDSATVALSLQNGQNGRSAIAQERIALAQDSGAAARFRWQAERPGRYSFLIEADPADDIPEPFSFNNTVTLQALVRADNIPPRLQITFDGRELVAPFEYVASRPEIVCQIFDENTLAIRDTSQVRLFVDGNRVFYSDPVAQPQLRLFSAGDKRAEVVLQPQFEPGEHTVAFLVNDVFGNRAAKSVSVKVSGEMALIDVLNYPNPFDRETEFTFTLTQPAEEIRIKIYTVAGRLIQTLETFAATPGFNRLHWDGRDADGDEIANGVYLYKIIARQGEKQVERIEKLAVAR